MQSNIRAVESRILVAILGGIAVDEGDVGKNYRTNLYSDRSAFYTNSVVDAKIVLGRNDDNFQPTDVDLSVDGVKLNEDEYLIEDGGVKLNRSWYAAKTYNLTGTLFFNQDGEEKEVEVDQKFTVINPPDKPVIAPVQMQVFYVGLNNGKELSINKFLLMPSIALKQERSSIGQWQMAQKLQLEYPTIGLKWLQSPLGKELGDPNMFALISPQFNVPQMISAYGELIGTRGTEKIGRVTIRGGIAFSLGEKMSEDGTIDLPIIYPRLSVYYNGVAIKVGGEYYRRSKTQWSYLIDYDLSLIHI